MLVGGVIVNSRKTVKEQGFTLIELLIVLSVVAILLGVVAPGFFDLIERNRLETGASKFLSSLMQLVNARNDC